MIRTLIMDDSPLVRRIFRKALSAAGDIDVVGEASDPFEARDLILSARPTVVVLDIEMPKMDGLTFLRKLMRYHPIRVVVCSALTTRGGAMVLDAMHAGAVGVVPKPKSAAELMAWSGELASAVRGAASAKLSRHEAPFVKPAIRVSQNPSRMLVAIGASTGGTTAIEGLLLRFEGDVPPIVITQHMPPYVTGLFAERLNRIAPMQVREAADGDVLQRGLALIAPGGLHLVVQREGATLRARIKDGPEVAGHRPSVDVLFLSVARAVGRAAVGVLLTGMGRDGARGMLAMRQAGAHTLAQDEASSVVFGMPKAAIELDAACQVCALDAMPEQIAKAFAPRAHTNTARP